MSLQPSPNAPVLSIEVIAAAMRKFLPGGTLAPLGAPDSISALRAAVPFQVYAADPDRYRSEGLLATARGTEWRALLLRGDTGVGWLAINDGDVTAIAVSEVAARAVDAISLGERLSRQGTHEVRFLESRAHAFAAIWLHGSNDVLIPISAGSAIQTQTAYDEAAITSALADATGCATTS